MFDCERQSTGKIRFHHALARKFKEHLIVTNSSLAVASSSWFQAQFDALKAKALAAWRAFEGDIAALANRLLPELEIDVETALETYGSDLVGEAVTLLSGGGTAASTASQIVTSLIQKIEAEGKTIGLATADTAAQQVTSAAIAGLQALVSQIAKL